MHASPVPAAKPRIFYGYIIVGAVFLCLFMFVGAFSSFGVFLKPISETFGWSRGATSGAVAVGWFFQGTFGIFMGRLCDRFGPRLTVAISGIIFGAGLLLMSCVNSLWQFYLVYGVIIGTGISGAIIPTNATVARWFTKRRSLMTGFAICGSASGGMVVPIVASNLLGLYGWRTTYLILGCVALVAIVLLSTLLKRDPSIMGLKPYGEDDGPGESERDKAPAEPAIGLAAAAKTRQFWMTAVVMLSMGVCIGTAQVHIISIATDMGIADTSAAIILSILCGMGIAGPIVMGHGADTFGIRRTLIAGYVIILASYIWLIPAGSYWQLVLFAIFLGFTTFGNVALQAPLGADMFGTHSIGVVFGALALGFAAGSAGGSYIPGLIYDATGGYDAAFIMCGALSIISIVLLALLRPVKTALL